MRALFRLKARTLSTLRLGCATAAVMFVAACAPAPDALHCGAAVPDAACSFRVVERFPHDPGAFTQGLVFHDGVLFEGTGLRGRSSVRRVDLLTGQILDIHALSPGFFGEGITIFGDRLVQLTLSSGVGFVYSVDELEPIGSFDFQPEGWGLTQDGEQLIMSDGTDLLRFLDPTTYELIRVLAVRDSGQPVRSLNELEFVRGELLANVWLTNRIARISPQTGDVLAWIDLTGLLGDEPPPGELNGIAYDARRDRLFVTGKNWPWLFEIEWVPEG